MKPSTELFDLIKSLTKSEKRYFALNAEKGSESKNYILLFNEIQKQEVYDEEAIKEKFAGKKFLNQLTFTKNYLYNAILKSLIAYNYERSVYARLADSIQRIKILYQKELFDQYFKAIKNARELAVKHEKFYLLLELLKIERVIVKIAKNKNRGIDEFYEEEKICIEKIQNLTEYSKLFSKIIKISRGQAQESEPIAEAEKLMSISIMENESEALSIQGLEYYYLIKQTYYSIKGETQNAFNACVKRLNCIEDNPRIFLDNIFDARIETLNNLISFSLRLKDYESFRYYIGKIEALKHKHVLNPDKETAHLELSYLLEAGEYDSAFELIPRVDEYLLKNKDKLFRDVELTIIFNTVKAYLLAGRHEQALEQMNVLINHKYLKYYKNVLVVSRLLNIIIHYELGNYDLVEYLLDSTKRYLTKKEELYKLEFSVIRLLRAMTKSRSPKEKESAVLYFRKEMDEISRAAVYKAALEFFDFLGWAERKRR